MVMSGLVKISVACLTLMLTVTQNDVTVTLAQVLRGGSDYGTSCDRRHGSPRKYDTSDAPCDIHEKSFCTEQGDAYPRLAVGQFVVDNQGLMRRMYGDLRHLSVLRNEMDDWQTNDHEDDDGSRNDIQKANAPVPGNDDDDDDGLVGRNYSIEPEETDVANETSESSSTTATTTTTTPPSPAVSSKYKKRPESEVKAEAPKGISACPTKKEVVAPYWAVNTRGKTLAIVNDPPYEQHVHWEKCLHENEQMLCRDGCKCEQQQRLQRLLAFDPNCDCKGVFMDWFLLPSCCVCKCYGLSYENVTTAATTTITDERNARGRRTGKLPIWNVTEDVDIH